MGVNIYPSEEKLFTALANYFVLIVETSLTDNNRFSFVLSGGNSPRKLYELLASPAFATRVPWERVDFFFGDERYVPLTDRESNYKMVNQSLFEPLQIKPSQIYGIDTGKNPAESAEGYAETISQYFSSYTSHFDFVLLGLGDNAHTASLFPSTPVLKDSVPSVASVFLADQHAFRITMNAPMLNLASHIVFLVYGASKADAVCQVLKAPRDPDHFPAQLISPRNGNLQWFMDTAAASKIS